MRKGADVLSKWVGEAEKQLRALFDEARKKEPSIIFFDEIDGLAPVRSSKQEQIHASIVSTLLALMDGLENRGRVVVVGATNRPDAVDPALRRPGRFDRELKFGLPDLAGRLAILKIHTEAWSPSEERLEDLARRTSGFCGADLKALASEAALNALRRAFPQIYESEHKLKIDISKAKPEEIDFRYALDFVVPCSKRSAASFALNASVPTSIFEKKLLEPWVRQAKRFVRRIFHAESKTAKAKRAVAGVVGGGEYVSMSHDSPHLHVSGPLADRVTNSLLASLESYSRFDASSESLAVSENPPSVALSTILTEALKSSPSVLVLANFDEFVADAPDDAWNLFRSFRRAARDDAVLLVTTCMHDPSDGDVECVCGESPSKISLSAFSPKRIVPASSAETVRRVRTDDAVASLEDSRWFFQQIVSDARAYCQDFLVDPLLFRRPPPLERDEDDRRDDANDAEEDEDRKRHVVREFQLATRSILRRLAKDRTYKDFVHDVDPEEVEDYYDVVSTPMSLDRMLDSLEASEYLCRSDVLKDAQQMIDNVLHYHPVGNERRKYLGPANDFKQALESEYRRLERAVRGEEEISNLLEDCERIAREIRGAVVVGEAGPPQRDEGGLLADVQKTGDDVQMTDVQKTSDDVQNDVLERSTSAAVEAERFSRAFVEAARAALESCDDPSLQNRSIVKIREATLTDFAEGREDFLATQRTEEDLRRRIGECFRWR